MGVTLQYPCLPWRGTVHRTGYGIYGLGGKQHLAHRRIYEQFIGRKLSTPELVMHQCDNPICVNPTHMLVGSVADNNREKLERGRQPHGPKMSKAGFSEWDVRSIRRLYASGATQKVLAAEFGVSQPAISAITRRKVWARLED